MYREGILSLGKAAEFAGATNKWEMLTILNERKVPIHYTSEDAEEDLKTFPYNNVLASQEDEMLQRIKYDDLKPRQKEQFNYQKLSAVLADYGFRTIPLGDDWNGADFLAYHIDGTTTLKVQLKGRVTFAEKYRGKELWIAFRDGNDFYLFPHDTILQLMLDKGRLKGTESWDDKGGYSFNYMTQEMKQMLAAYKI